MIIWTSFYSQSLWKVRQRNESRDMLSYMWGVSADKTDGPAAQAKGIEFNILLVQTAVWNFK